MSEEVGLLERYNYPDFTPQYFQPWMRFDQSPPLSETRPNSPLWHAEDGHGYPLDQLWSKARYTIVEFGSFT